MTETCEHCGEPLVKVGRSVHHDVDVFRCGCCAPLTDDEQALADEAARLVERIATVHERHACPKCDAPVGVRCTRVDAHLLSVAPKPLKHSHAERRRLEVPDR